MKITEEYKEAFNHIENNNSGVTFLTGNAGTGKSTFLKYFLKNTSKRVALIAPTGIAALNIGGQTIHSFFKLPIGITADQPQFKNSMLTEILESIDLIVIDEFGMVRADLVDVIDKKLRVLCKSEDSFGEKQILGIGDLYQLPPVLKNEEKDGFYTYYNTRYFFSAQVFKTTKIKVFQLTITFRQKNLDFVRFLNELRLGNAMYPLNLINKRFYIESIPDCFEGTVLCTLNRSANNINQYKLHEIKEQSEFYYASKSGKFNALPVSKEIELKVGCRVVLCKNTADYKNGETGVVTKLNSGSVLVLKDNGSEIRVSKETWEQIEYDETVGRFTQIPVKLGYAITIHKSQGMTFDTDIIIDTGNGCFETGQFYVAMSRITDPAKVRLLRKLTNRDIKADFEIHKFLEK